MPAPDLMGKVLERWQERLIDVSKSNPLLGLNRSRSAKLEIESPELEYLVKTLFNDEGSIKLPFVQKKLKRVYADDEDQNKDEYVLYQGDIDFTYSNLVDLRRKLRRIFDNSQLTINERGVNTLYLTIGCLEWEDAFMGKSESPLIMVPCILEFHGSSKPMELRMSDEEIVINPALRYYLKQREEITLLEEIPKDFSFDKINELLEAIESSIKINEWKVSRRSWLGIFSFETLAIYQDLKLLDSEARNNKLVRAIAHIENTEIGDDLNLDNDLDDAGLSNIVPIPVVKADSSQLKAITMASQGLNLVIHGPPGTGKSQTITSIIANSLGQGKKVLFVSAKMAALNVVHSRLQSIGLGQYCLEAHGIKSGKRKVIDELKYSLEANDEIKIANNLKEDIDKLIKTKTDLNEYVRCLHDKNNALSLSLYNVYGRFEKLKDVPDVAGSLPWNDILNVSKEQLDYIDDILLNVGANSDLFISRDNHPLRGMDATRMDAISTETVSECINKLIFHCELIKKSIDNLLNVFFKNINISILDFFSSVEVLNLLATADKLPENWVIKDLDILEKELDDIVKCLEAIEKRNNENIIFFSFTSKQPSEIINILNSYKEKYSNWYSYINLNFFRDRSLCQRALDKINGTEKNIFDKVLLSAKSLILAEEELKESLNKSSLDYDIDHIPIEDIEYIKHQYEVAISLRKWANTFSVEFIDNPKFDENISLDFVNLVNNLEIFKKDFRYINEQINNYWANGFFGEIKIDENSLSVVLDSSRLILCNLKQVEIRNWQLISKIYNVCKDASIISFVNKIDKILLSKVREIFQKRFYFLWIDATIHSKNVLNDFSGESYKNLINKFKILDEKIQRLTLINTIAEPAKIARQLKVASNIGGDSSGIGKLRKEIQKKKKIKPLRILFNEIPQVLQALKPCFLMSPLSVSSFLKPGIFNFDIVIFDEASQLLTPEAIPSILRSKQVVVAGDSKQLPPTSFFRSNIIDDSDEYEENKDDSLESLLDDCKATIPFFRETDLKWHYRSKDERLILFSNNYFYDNRLITFPSPDIDNNERGVVLEYIPDGVWDRGGSRVNRKEARHTAKLIIKHFEQNPDKSLGVVSLNSSQKEAIEDALEEEIQSRPDLVPFLDKEKKEAFFVKSLENVQGDERDVIIISIGYGKGQDGRVSLNFGPINNQGGWRRLNVLITRAKWKVVLVTSIRSSELVGINPENEGLNGLKNYIKYAETGYIDEKRKDFNPLPDEETNDFEDSVKKELSNRGFIVDSQIGAGSFKIDLAIKDSRDATGYAIGIECDGASYHSSRFARDRDILRQEILEGMGWKICRVWSTDWFRNRESALNSLISNVKNAIDALDKTSNDELKEIKNESMDLSNELKSVTFRDQKVGIPYKKVEFRYNREIVIESHNIHKFVEMIRTIIDEEGPIHKEILIERIKELTRIGRVGANIHKNFDKAIKIALEDKIIEENEEDRGFFSKPRKEYANFRIPGDGVLRRLNQISALEIKNAIKYLVKNQFGLAYDNAVYSLKEVFEINRIDPEECDRVKDLIDEMIAQESIIKQGPLLNIKP